MKSLGEHLLRIRKQKEKRNREAEINKEFYREEKFIKNLIYYLDSNIIKEEIKMLWKSEPHYLIFYSKNKLLSGISGRLIKNPSKNVLLYTHESIEGMPTGYFTEFYLQKRNFLKNIHQELEMIYFNSLAKGVEDGVYSKELIKDFIEINGDKREKNYLRLVTS